VTQKILAWGILYVRAKHMTAFDMVSTNSPIVALGFTCIRTSSLTHAFLSGESDHQGINIRPHLR
jgi:hypothetical protein